MINEHKWLVARVIVVIYSSIVHLTARGRPLEVPEVDSTGKKLIVDCDSNNAVVENGEKTKI